MLLAFFTDRCLVHAACCLLPAAPSSPPVLIPTTGYWPGRSFFDVVSRVHSPPRLLPSRLSPRPAMPQPHLPHLHCRVWYRWNDHCNVCRAPRHFSLFHGQNSVVLTASETYGGEVGKGVGESTTIVEGDEGEEEDGTENKDEDEDEEEDEDDLRGW